MIRRTALTVCLMVGCVCCLAVVARVDSAQPGPRTIGFKPVSAVTSLMRGQVQHFKAIQALLADPQAQKRGERLVVEAELLAELANVNFYNQDKPDYRRWADELRKTALDIANEAKKRGKAGEDKLESLLESAKSICVSCHDVYQ